MPFGLALKDILSDARIRDIALGDQPAWLWDVTSACVPFANAGGLSLFGEEDLAALRARVFAEEDPVGRQIGRVAATLPRDGGARMAMLRLASAGHPVPTACRCRLVEVDGHDLVLVVAVGGKNDARPLAERLAVLFRREDAAVAARVDGADIYANPASEAAEGPSEVTHRFALPSSAGEVSVAWSDVAATAAPGAEPVAPPEPLHGAFDPAEATLATAEAAPAVEAVAIPNEPAPPVEPEAEAKLEAMRETGSGMQSGSETETVSAAEPPGAGPVREEPASRQRRFTFALDAEGKVTEVGPALRQAVGERGAVGGRRWREFSHELALDPAGEIERMIETRDTWSGVVVDWPREAGGRIGVRLAALPRFGEGRQFLGYRGFGEILEDTAVQPAAPPVEAVAEEAAGEEPATPAGEAPKAPGQESEPVDRGAAANNVHRLHPAQEDEDVPSIRLNERERSAFHAIARVLGARLHHEEEHAAAPAEANESAVPDENRLPQDEQAPGPREAGPHEEAAPEEPEGETATSVAVVPEEAPEATGAAPVGEPEPEPEAEPEPAAPPVAGGGGQVDAPRLTLDLLARLPWGVGVVRNEELIYANRSFLDIFGFSDLDDLDIAGGLSVLLEGRSTREAGGATVQARHRDGSRLEIEARLSRAEWIDGPAMLLAVRRAEPIAPLKEEIERLRAVVDLASDGTVILDHDWRILEVNKAAQQLIGDGADSLVGRPFLTLVPDDNRAIAEDYLDGLTARRGQILLDDGVELVLDGEADGAPVPAFVTGALMAGQAGPQICLVLRDLRRWKTAEAEALTARRRAEQANEKKSDFLAKMSHEIRTPLNAIIGFAEVMLEERFGPIGTERYRDYLKDVRESGEHIMSLVNDLLDLSKVEAGRMDLTFTGVKLNDIVEQTVAIMQPQANRQRVIIRTSLSMGVPPIVADSRSLRQVMMNLLSNGIKFTPPGGQVIVSTMLTDAGDVSLRVRDTGVGMTEAETEIALEPFRQVGARHETGIKGSGLGLPLTKALVEANRAHFAIRSRPGEGTLVEITFPQSRVLAE